MINLFLICIQDSLVFLVICLYLLSGLTLFGEKEQREGKHILYSLLQPQLQTRLSLLPFHCYIHLSTDILNFLVLFYHSYYLCIASA